MTANQSSFSSAPASSPAPPERRVDPSMEDILASIRKIIADEDAPSARVSVAPAARPRDPDDARQGAVVTPISPQISSQALGPRPAGQPMFGLSRPGMAPPTPAPPPPSPRDSLSTTTGAREGHGPPAAVGRAFDAPSGPASPPFVLPVERPDEPQSRSPDQTAGAEPEPPDVGALVSAATTDSIASAFQALTASVAMTNAEVVDRHVRDMLRPMLRAWLDDNLPTIVEKMVRAEIERVARGGR